MTTLATLEARGRERSKQMTKAELIARVVGKKITDVIWSERTFTRGEFPGGGMWTGFILEDGTQVVAEGGEDADGGYGLLEISEE